MYQHGKKTTAAMSFFVRDLMNAKKKFFGKKCAKVTKHKKTFFGNLKNGKKIFWKSRRRRKKNLEMVVVD